MRPVPALSSALRVERQSATAWRRLSSTMRASPASASASGFAPSTTLVSMACTKERSKAKPSVSSVATTSALSSVAIEPRPATNSSAAWRARAASSRPREPRPGGKRSPTKQQRSNSSNLYTTSGAPPSTNVLPVLFAPHAASCRSAAASSLSSGVNTSPRPREKTSASAEYSSCFSHSLITWLKSSEAMSMLRTAASTRATSPRPARSSTSACMSSGGSDDTVPARTHASSASSSSAAAPAPSNCA
mmetsp:Transcript_6568/g.26748  ORF Transcript_6568/g.26748 Transcript_6568/m.26748 type:complete len:247 (-) Transcript_6568:2908-3648(-)